MSGNILDKIQETALSQSGSNGGCIDGSMLESIPYRWIEEGKCF